MKNVTIMRGLPGCGKSTYIKKWFINLPNIQIVSADNYFMMNGVYAFDQLKLGLAHNDCLRRYLDRLNTLHEHVIVDNTNIRAYEIAPYYRLAEAYGYDPKIIWIQRSASLCIKQNIHKVPEGTIKSMANSFEPIPHWWNQEVIVNHE